jgi:YegS/Rv2252/BmrU family lipid kinase
VASQVCLIVNPAAAGGKAGRLAPELDRALRGHGLAVRMVETRSLAHARELAREAARAGETVVALSGDGMVGAIADTLREVPGAVLGILPGGRGNDFARVLGLSEDPSAACETIAHGSPRAVDMGEAGGRGFVGIASVGFDSDANSIANEAPGWLGALVYAYAALRALASWRPATFEIELDPPGERHTFTGYSVGAANSKAYGGGMFAAPDALLDDGMLEIVVCEHMSRVRFLTSLLPKIFKGTHVDLPTVRVFRAREVDISADRPFTMYADGDPIGELPLRVRALPGAVNVLVPLESQERPAFAAAHPATGMRRADEDPAAVAPARGDGSPVEP